MPPAPCEGPLLIAQKVGPAVAIVKVSDVSFETAIVQVQPAGNRAAPVLAVNDQLEISSLVDNDDGSSRTGLKFSLRLNTISQSQNLVFSDGTTNQTVDMTPFVKTQLENYLVNVLGRYFIY